MSRDKGSVCVSGSRRSRGWWSQPRASDAYSPKLIVLVRARRTAATCQTVMSRRENACTHPTEAQTELVSECRPYCLLFVSLTVSGSSGSVGRTSCRCLSGSQSMTKEALSAKRSARGHLETNEREAEERRGRWKWT